jgi:hypothetical protein
MLAGEKVGDALAPVCQAGRLNGEGVSGTLEFVTEAVVRLTEEGLPFLCLLVWTGE